MHQSKDFNIRMLYFYINKIHVFIFSYERNIKVFHVQCELFVG